MKGKFSVLAAIVLLLVGCEQSDVSVVADSAYSPPSASLEMNRVRFSGGNEISFNGRLFQYQLLQNDRGEFDRYTIDSVDNIMALEGAVFAQLAKFGYTRRIRVEVPERFVVNYLKKGSAPISAVYTVTDKATKTKSATKTRVVFTAKVTE